MKYIDQLKHPLWQKKRLEVLDANGFKCQRCESEDNTLHVHHIQYISGRKAWEYPLQYFGCYCDKCHAEIHSSEKAMELELLRIDRDHRARKGIVTPPPFNGNEFAERLNDLFAGL